MYSVDAHARFNYTPGVYQETFGAKGIENVGNTSLKNNISQN